MKIASILLQFFLITSLIACMNPFSACSHYFENIRVISDANRLTAFSMMVISIEGNFRAIWKIIFFVNGILLLLPVLHLALVFLICMVYLVFFTLYCFSTRVCAYLVGKSFVRFASFHLRSTFIWPQIDTLGFVQLFLTILLLTEKTLLFKDAG